MDDFELEIKKDFLQEASEILESAEQSFLQLENDPSNEELIDTIFRVAHNLKGSSRAVGFGQIAELTHVAENLLLEIKQGRLTVTAEVVSSLLNFNDKVREMVQGLGEDLNAVFTCQHLIEEFERVLNGKNKPIEDNNESTIQEDQVELNSTDEEDSFLPEGISSTQQVVKEVKRRVTKEDETLRVSVGRLEKLNDIVGELVILETLIENSLSKVGEIKIARSLGKLCKGIQDLSMSLRMIQIGPTFQKLTRIVRDTSKALDKKINLQLLGEDTEIDKIVAESLGDPLVHIIRNAIDHGIESPSERLSAGKSEEGTVEVMAFHEGNFLIIQITDDGKGIDPDKLIIKAKERGIIQEGQQLSEQQGLELIFHPGFSTKDEVSEVSGRGVGMDVVRTNIESLGGSVKVRSKIGKGSCFRLMLPLTLAIIEGMLIESNNQIFVIPKSQVQEVIRIEAEQVSHMTGRVPYLVLRDEVIPLFNLENDVGCTNCDEPGIAVIIRNGEMSFAVGIADVVRLQQVVVKPVTKEMFGRQGIMGTTILGDGKPSLILDLINLYSSKVHKEKSIASNRAS